MYTQYFVLYTHKRIDDDNATDDMQFTDVQIYGAITLLFFFF